MNETTKNKRRAVKELEKVVESVSSTEIDQLVSGILNTRRIFLFGLGRTLLMGRAFIMRLMHLGMDAFVVGDTTTPGITAEDLLIVCSGSGQTDSTFLIAEKGKKLAAVVALVTANPNSRIGGISDLVLKIPAQTKTGSDGAEKSIHPMATVFEQSLLLVFALVVLELMAKMDKNAEDMLRRHANLE